MEFISADTVYQCLTYGQLTDGLLRLHREEPAALQDMLLGEGRSGPDNFILIRAAFQSGKAVGVKMATVFPGNQSLPAVQAAFVIFDGRNGAPLGMIDGTALTHRKTAADSALGSKLLSREDSKSLLMVGAGGMSPHLIRAHLAVRPKLQTVRLWNRTAARAHAVVELLDHEGITVEVADDLAESVATSDIICCATMSNTPIIKGEWLQPGSHLDLVGAYRIDMREADDECLRKSHLFVDSRKTTIGEIGEIDIPLKAGVITEQSIIADYYDLANPEFAWRRAGTDITVLKNGGGGHLDLMTARLIFEQALPGVLP
ncbi:MAG: ornithine cyclodeaminase [Gammaproteobacteria bacterium]|nr:ornithine cyclodeaminase [Gammaproteobacteria bacterium]